MTKTNLLIIALLFSSCGIFKKHKTQTVDRSERDSSAVVLEHITSEIDTVLELPGDTSEFVQPIASKPIVIETQWQRLELEVIDGVIKGRAILKPRKVPVKQRTEIKRETATTVQERKDIKTKSKEVERDNRVISGGWGWILLIFLIAGVALGVRLVKNWRK